MSRPIFREEDPIFTRYLYEKLHVKHSLAFAMLRGDREEALFWAYELYHSGFQEYVWNWLHEIYAQCYDDDDENSEARIAPLLRVHKWRQEWQKTGDPCLLGSAVGTLAMRSFLSKNGRANEKFVILYPNDRYATVNPLAGKAYQHLSRVSKYPVSKEAIDLVESLYGKRKDKIRTAYLGTDWLYYCRDTPIWSARILEGGGKIDDEKKMVVFSSDEMLEAFYERWGLEPDEQCKEMHIWHGVRQ